MFNNLFGADKETWEESRDGWFKLLESQQEFVKSFVDTGSESYKSLANRVILTNEQCLELAKRYDEISERSKNALRTGTNEMIDWQNSLTDNERCFISGYATAKSIHQTNEIGIDLMEGVLKFAVAVSK